jgi:hypothetical protein
MLNAVGVEHVSSEKVSGVTAKHPELERVVDELKTGDVSAPTGPSRSRLARLEQLALRRVDPRGGGLKSLAKPRPAPRQCAS